MLSSTSVVHHVRFVLRLLCAAGAVNIEHITVLAMHSSFFPPGISFSPPCSYADKQQARSKSDKTAYPSLCIWHSLKTSFCKRKHAHANTQD